MKFVKNKKVITKLNPAQTKDWAVKFKVLSNESRLTIFQLLTAGPMNATELLNNISISQTLLSHHLKSLKSAGLIEGQKKGHFINYRLTAKNKFFPHDKTLSLDCCKIKFNDGSI